MSAEKALVGFTPSLDNEGPQRRKRAEAAQNKRSGHKKVLDGLRKVIRDVVDAQNTPSSTSFFGFFRKARQQTLSKDDFQKLVEVAHDAFPPRMDLPVLVCDVTLETAKVYPVQLKDIEKCKLLISAIQHLADVCRLEDTCGRRYHSPLDVSSYVPNISLTDADHVNLSHAPLGNGVVHSVRIHPFS